ncbi:SurE-like protein [Coleophoma cylindrospora]|uniref:SurE-like protein n=1 Tax=Coleophoma cylindrospora TaxID=1849047 RepID=A0A3D8QSV3_9HELO|nr:SurE-like protein [Coleophoma cylindrospora]
MHFRSLITATAALASAANCLNILITNDDGFGVSNIREFYKAVKAFGHNAYIVASTSNQSGTGGTVVFTTAKNLTADTEFGIVKAGAPSVGTDPNDSHIWYYNGTPSACVQVALDYILPTFANVTTPDLVLSGPNYGWNLGPFLYTLSGTMGATYTAVERGIPAIAYSGGYSVQTPYFQVNSTTAAGLKDPATIAGQLSANLAQQLILNAAATGSKLMPVGYGISVNLPYITSFTNSSCVDPPFIQTRMTSGADVDGAAYNATSGLFTYKNIVDAGLNTCINGDCSLPGETNILNAGCQSSVSVFAVDYDAPTSVCGQGSATSSLRALLQPLVQDANSTNLIGGLNGTSAAPGTGNATATTGGGTSSSTGTLPPASTSAPVSSVAGPMVDFSWVAVAGGMMLGALWNR